MRVVDYTGGDLAGAPGEGRVATDTPHLITVSNNSMIGQQESLVAVDAPAVVGTLAN